MASNHIQNNITLPTLSQTNPNTSYANKARSLPQINYSKKEQSIILSALPNTPIENYMIALADIIDPLKILYTGKMSNNRICVCLKTKEDVDNITKNYKTIKVNGQDITLRKFLTPSQRMVIWIFPSVPNETIITYLTSKGVKCLSEMYFMSAGIKDERFSHVKGFHRYIYIHEDHPTIPAFTDIPFENENQRMYMTIDESKCTKCQKFGHESTNCRTIIGNPTGINNPPNINYGPLITSNVDILNDTTLNTQEMQQMDTQEAQNIQDTTLQNQEEEILPSASQTIDIPIQPDEQYSTDEENSATQNDAPKKRHLSNSSNSEIERPIKHKANIPKNKTEKEQIVTTEMNPTEHSDATLPEKKKTLSSMLEILKEPITNEPEKFIFNFDELICFTKEVQGKTNIESIIKKFKKPPDQIIQLLDTIYHMVTDPITKTLITKLIKKIKIQTTENSSSE